MKSLLSLFIFFSLPTFAQKDVSNVRSVLIEADSVIIVSHKSLFVAEKPIGVPAEKGKQIVENGKPNYSIIIRSNKLDRKSIDSLADILTKEVDGDIVKMACFDPHHAVFIFKKGQISYFDICFGCQDFLVSKDIKTTGHRLTNETWAELESFFVRRGIENKNPF